MSMTIQIAEYTKKPVIYEFVDINDGPRTEGVYILKKDEQEHSRPLLFVNTGYLLFLIRQDDWSIRPVDPEEWANALFIKYPRKVNIAFTPNTY